jgi:asparagine synthase (glutamine-hydrolysing)
MDAAGQAALGHRRLAIIDLTDRAGQPMVSDDGRYVISFNGEIYNYRELRAKLEDHGRLFRSDSDTEVLLQLYAEKGAEMLRDLRGMFAFAIWDTWRKGMFLARDPFGIKPLYYAADGTRFWVASEVKALAQIASVDTERDPAGATGFFLWGSVPEPHTVYRGIRALPSGSSMWVDERGPQAPVVYAGITQLLKFAEQARRDAGPSEIDAESHAALSDSVSHHLVADVDIGLFLSAGLDSSLLAAHLFELGGRMKTVTLGFEQYRGTPQDETVLAEAQARRCGFDHRTVWMSRDEFVGELPRLLQRMDQPTIDGVNVYFVARAAASVGLKVALSGLGGDELLGGYPSFTQIPILVSTMRAVPGLSILGRGWRMVTRPLHGLPPKLAGLLEYGSEYGDAYLLRRGLFLPWELPSLVGDEVAAEGLSMLSPRLRVRETVDQLSNAHMKVSALEASWYMRNQLLRDTDWASMSHSLEVRVPFVDWNLWQRIAPLLVGRHKPTKKSLARLPKLPLPPAHLDRPKTGFTVPVTQMVAALHSSTNEGRGSRGWAKYVGASLLAQEAREGSRSQ